VDHGVRIVDVIMRLTDDRCDMSDMHRTGPLTVEARVRARNQVTIPDAVARALGLRDGSRLLIRTDGDRAEIVVIRDTYAGTLSGLWGADPSAWLTSERDGWER
jgi:AbrB family looped-hinge helix DNA binding protein